MTVYYRYGGPVSVDRALTVPCPECGQPSGSGCVYIWPRDLPVQPLEYFRFYARGTRDRVARVGTPTAKPHNGRCALYSLDRSSAYRLRRMKQLRAWLRAYGDIFKEDR